jgi:hypothetical protein
MKEFRRARVLGSRAGGEPDSDEDTDWGDGGAGIGTDMTAKRKIGLMASPKSCRNAGCVGLELFNNFGAE